MRNPECPSSSSEDESDEEEEMKPPSSKNENGKRATPKSASQGEKKQDPQQKRKKKEKSGQEEEIQVEFTFCDMAERYFHGLKSLLDNSSTVYQVHSSELADHMIANISVGTVVSTAGDEDGTVFGFASILNVSTFQESPAIQHLKSLCLKNCPKEHQSELETVLSGKTKRPAGFMLHGRMINMPLEIVEVLHKQLVLDMDWAVENAEGGEAERKSLDFGAFVRLAPCQKEQQSFVYRYFDDEILAGQAEFIFTMDAPKSYSKEEKQYVNVIVMTKTGHRAAMKDLAQMIHGAVPVGN